MAAVCSKLDFGFMKQQVFCWILFLTVFTVSGQESILKLSPGKRYQFYFVYVRLMDTGLEQIDTIKNKFTVTWDKDKSFLVDDKETINKLQKEWKGKRAEQIYFCWYDYFLYVVEDGKIIDELRVNEECKQVVCKHGDFGYPQPVLDDIKRDKNITVAWVRFKSTAIGRTFIRDATVNSNIYLPGADEGEWTKFDGSISIKTKGTSTTKKTQEAIEKKISKEFPGEKFKIRSSMVSREFLVFEIYCQENLAKRLKGFEIWHKWKPIDPGGILMISNVSDPIETLIKEYNR